ncbi:MAG: Crp/Fnr family transcriptional regulator [Oscillospiraceae bacterium]|nr:Crp/Fnr family transcriptional regulator [Oscillospiraceae bacterium]
MGDVFFLKEKGYEEHFYTAGSIILDSRSQTKLIYHIKSGHAGLQVYTSDLRPGLWFSFSEGDYIGVIEAFSSYEYPVSEIYALSDCIVQTAEISILKKRLEHDSKLAVSLLNSMAEQMMSADRWNLMRNTSTIIDQTIVSLSSHYQNQTLDTLKKGQLCNELSIPKRSLNRALQSIRSMVSYENKKFIVTDPEMLIAKASDIMERFDLNT